MEFNVKVNVDTDEAIEKLERIKQLYEEINQLKNEKPVVNLKIHNETDTEQIRSYVNEKNAEEARLDLKRIPVIDDNGITTNEDGFTTLIDK